MAFLAIFSMFIAMLGGCTPESRHGLPDTTRVAPDSRLVGSWTARLLGADYHVEIEPRNPRALTVRVSELYSPAGGTPRLRRETLELYAHEVDGVPLLALRGPALDARDGESWRFARYRFAGDDRLMLSFLSEQALHFWVRSEQFGGRIRSPDETFPDIVLTEPPSRLAGFLIAHDPAVMFSVSLGPFQRQ